MSDLRIGNGYDIHRLVNDKPLILGNVNIPFHSGLLAHSDGDVLIHAIIDSLLGAANLGDIGTHFPDNDPQYKGMDSSVLLKKTVDLLHEKKFEIINIDTIIICEKPRLKEFIPSIKSRLAGIIGVNPEVISVKAKTKEQMDATGAGEAMEAYSISLIRRKKVEWGNNGQ